MTKCKCRVVNTFSISRNLRSLYAGRGLAGLGPVVCSSQTSETDCVRGGDSSTSCLQAEAGGSFGGGVCHQRGVCDGGVVCLEGAAGVQVIRAGVGGGGQTWAEDSL